MTDGIAALGGSSNLSAIDALLDNSQKTNKKEDEDKQKDIFDLLFQTIDESLEKTQENMVKIEENPANSFANSNFGPPSNVRIEHIEGTSSDNSLAENIETSIKETLSQFKASQSYANANFSNLMKSAFEAIF